MIGDLIVGVTLTMLLATSVGCMVFQRRRGIGSCGCRGCNACGRCKNVLIPGDDPGNRHG